MKQRRDRTNTAADESTPEPAFTISPLWRACDALTSCENIVKVAANRSERSQS